MLSQGTKKDLLKQSIASSPVTDGNTTGGGDWGEINNLNRVTFDENEHIGKLNDDLGVIADEFAEEAKKLAESRKQTHEQNNKSKRSFWSQFQSTLLEIIPEETEDEMRANSSPVVVNGYHKETWRHRTARVSPVIHAADSREPLKMERLQKIAAMLCVETPAEAEVRRLTRRGDIEGPMFESPSPRHTRDGLVAQRPLLQWFRNLRGFIMW